MAGGRLVLGEAEAGDDGFDAQYGSDTHAEDEADAENGEHRSFSAMGHGHRQDEADDGGNQQPTQSTVHDLLAAQAIATQFARSTGNRWPDEREPCGNQGRKRAYDRYCRLHILASDRNKIFGPTTRTARPPLPHPANSLFRDAHVQRSIKIVHPDERYNRTLINIRLLLATAHPICIDSTPVLVDQIGDEWVERPTPLAHPRWNYSTPKR